MVLSNYFLRPVGKINHSNSVRKRGIARSIRVNHPDRPIWKVDLLAPVGVVILDLLVREVVGFHPVLMGHLSCL